MGCDAQIPSVLPVPGRASGGVLPCAQDGRAGRHTASNHGTALALFFSRR